MGWNQIKTATTVLGNMLCFFETKPRVGVGFCVCVSHVWLGCIMVFNLVTCEEESHVGVKYVYMKDLWKIFSVSLSVYVLSCVIS